MAPSLVSSGTRQRRKAGLSYQLLLLLVLQLCQPGVLLAGSRLHNTTSIRSPTKLNVHLIPHTHLDPGWLHTFEQYYRGWPLNKEEDRFATFAEGSVTDGVSRIIDSVVGSLLLNPDRTFTFADMAFFAKWWQEQSDHVRGQVRALVASGQLQFVNGGLVQHDEATSHYSSIIDQMGIGMRFLANELGVEPRVAWMIDDFGHSRTEPLLRTQGGFKAMFFARADRTELAQREESHQTELVWRGSPAFGPESDLWVSMNPFGVYTMPDETWSHESSNMVFEPLAEKVLEQPSSSNPNSKSPEILTLLEQFYRKALDTQKAIPPGQNDIMMYMGSDFAFKNASLWFDWLDRLVHHANREGVMNVMYSTPERFLAAKKAAGGVAAADGSNGGSSGSSNGGSSSREGLAGMMHSTAEKFLAAENVAAGTAAGSAAAEGSNGGSNGGSSTPEGSVATKGRVAAGAAAVGGSSGDGSGSRVRWPLKGEDFLPYRCDMGKAWTGFYSSRPTLKGMIRQAAAVLQATRQLEVIAGLNPSSQTLTTSKGRDLLYPQPPSGIAATADTAAAAAAADWTAAQRTYTAAAAAVANAAAVPSSSDTTSSSGSDTTTTSSSSSSRKAELQQRVREAGDAITAAKAARDSNFVSAVDAFEWDGVPQGPDAAVLEFAVALAHHHDAITGTHRLAVGDDYIHWLHVGLLKALPKMLLALQRLAFAAGPTTHAPSSSSSSTYLHQQAPAAAAAEVVPAASGATSSDRTRKNRKDLWRKQQQQQQQQVTHAGDTFRALLQSGGALAAEALPAAAAAAKPPIKAYSSSSSNNSSALLLPPADVVSLALPLPGLTPTPGSSSSSSSGVGSDLPPLSYCLLLNASLCSTSVHLTRGHHAAAGSAAGGAGGAAADADAAAAAAGGAGVSDGFLLVVYNPLSWPRHEGVRVPVAAERNYKVTGPGGAPVPSQLLTLPPLTQQLWQASNLTQLAARQGNVSQLAFQVQVPALGHAVYRVHAVAAAAEAIQTQHIAGDSGSDGSNNSGSSSGSSSSRVLVGLDDVTLTNGVLEVTVSAEEGGITTVKLLSSSSIDGGSSSGGGGSGGSSGGGGSGGSSGGGGSGGSSSGGGGSGGSVYSYSSQLVVYAVGGLFDKAGAYVFSARKQSQRLPAPSKVEVLQGEVLSEVRQSWSGLGSLTTRLWRGRDSLEVEWTAGPPPTAGGNRAAAAGGGSSTDWEVFVRYSSDVQSGGVWYTDANGLEWQQRRLGYRPSYDLKDSYLPANIYPITTGALLREREGSASSPSPRSLYLSTDRAQGATSLQDGQLDVLLHRSSANDDGKGMDQPLIDTNAALGRHIISFAPSKAAAAAADPVQLHARHHQQYLNDPLQLAFSPLPPPGTFIRETSSFVQAPLQPPAAATAATATAAGAANPAATNVNGHHRRSHRSSSGGGERDNKSGSSSSSSSGGSGGSSSSSGRWQSLPSNVHVLSLQWRSCSSLLVRLVNTFQAGEDTQVPLSQPPAAAAGRGGAFNAAAAAAAAAAAVTSSRAPPAKTTQAGEQPQVSLSDTASVESLWTLFNWGSSQGSDVAVSAWDPGLSVVDVREVTLFGGQRALTESDLQPALKGWPLGGSITKWDPALWPTVGGNSSSRGTSPPGTAADRATAAIAETEAGSYSFLFNRVVGPMDAATPVTLAPMQVRSFLVTVRRQGPAAGPFVPYGVLQPCSDESPAAAAAAAAAAAVPVSAVAAGAAGGAKAGAAMYGGGDGGGAAKQATDATVSALQGTALAADGSANAASMWQHNAETIPGGIAHPVQPPQQQAQGQASTALQTNRAASAAALANTAAERTGDSAAAAAAVAYSLKPSGSSLHLTANAPPSRRAIPWHIVLLWRLPLCVAAVAVASLIMRTARRVSGSGKGSGARLSRPLLSRGRLGAGRLR